jgi:hypothetical protein
MPHNIPTYTAKMLRGLFDLLSYSVRCLLTFIQSCFKFVEIGADESLLSSKSSKTTTQQCMAILKGHP